MEKYVEIREPMISADKVYARWPGMHGHEYEMARLIDLSADLFAPDDTPIAYSVQKILEDGNGGIIAECTTFDPSTDGKYYPPYSAHHQGSDIIYDFSNIAFKLSEIIKYENNNPKLLFNVITDIDKAWNPSEYIDEYLRIEDIRKYLQLSPYQFICFLNDDSNPNRLITSWEEGFTARLMNGGYGGGRVPFFAIEDLSNEDLRVHSMDWNDFKQREKKKMDPQSNENTSSTIVNIDTISVEFKLIEAQKELNNLRGQLAEAQILIAELKANPSKEIDFSSAWAQDSPEYVVAVASIGDIEEAKNLIAEKDARIVELEAKLAALETTNAQQATTRTTAATQVRQERTLNAWKPAIDAMIKVAIRCGEEGRVLRQQPDFNAMFNELDAVLNNEQVALFRKALPDEHIDRTGGPKGKGTPS